MLTDNEFLGRLAADLELDGLSFDDNGRVELPINEVLQIIVARIDSRTIELIAPLDLFLALDVRANLSQLLAANFLGAGSGAGRMAVDPATGDIVLCERLALNQMSEADVLARFESFAGRAHAWSDAKAAELFKPAEAIPYSEMTLRV